MEPTADETNPPFFLGRTGGRDCAFGLNNYKFFIISTLNLNSTGPSLVCIV